MVARVLTFAVAIILSGLMGYSRLFLGSHSLNQIIFGLSLGVWGACTMHFILKDMIMKHANEILYTPEALLLSRLLYCAVIMVFAIFIPIINIQMIHPTLVMEESWET